MRCIDTDMKIISATKILPEHQILHIYKQLFSCRHSRHAKAMPEQRSPVLVKEPYIGNINVYF